MATHLFFWYTKGTFTYLLTNHGAALATKPGRCGMKKKLPKKGTAGGPEKKRDTRSAHSLVWSFGFLKFCFNIQDCF